jgi:tight adherence protein C
VTLSLILGLALTGLAVGLVVRAFALSRARTNEIIGQIEFYGFAGPAPTVAPNLRRGLDDLAGVLGNVVAARFGIMNETELRQHLISAGMYRLSPRMLMGYQVLSAVAFPAAWAWFSTALALGGVMTVLGVLVTAVMGWLAPVSIVRRRGRHRLLEIDYALPELIDLLVVTVEAGVGFSGSLQVAAERLTGPLGDELRLTVQEQRMGLSSMEALENTLKRAPTPAMGSFVRAMVQGERLGVSVGQILRSLALEMRKRRRALAEEKAHKAPIKMLFPLVFLIFPAMFVVLLGPAMFAIIDALSGIGK